MAQLELSYVLAGWAGGEKLSVAVANVIGELAGASMGLAERIAEGSIFTEPAAPVGDNESGDAQKALDVEAHERFLAALKRSPVATLYSEEAKAAIAINDGGALVVAMDPLDGSSNIIANISVGTIFSIFPSGGAALPRGTDQLAAGFFIYGPLTALVLSVGAGVMVFTLDRKSGRYILTDENSKIPARAPEYAINASNYRHWDEPVRAYIDDCIVGVHGPREENFNMRWVASLVAEAYRILQRGGIFLYPRDARKGYQQGRLRLLYEAFAIAYLMEQAGGAATDGVTRILDIEPKDLHQRTPLIFGSERMVERVGAYHRNIERDGGRSPLFRTRGLFRR
jgi:fructose-1,6-bisphosphatase I